MKKIIVFGANGDIGRYFIEYLFDNKVNEHYEIIASGTKVEYKWENYTGLSYVKIDISNQKDFEKLPQDDIYAVVDFAGYMPARMEGYDLQKYIDVNITGTLNILNYCKKVGADRILFTQSFGDIKDNAEKRLYLTPFDERNFSLNSDHSVYVLSKNFAVDLIEHYHQKYGLKNFIFRLPTIYLYSPIENYYVDGLVRKIGYRILIDKAINGEEIEVWGDPNRKKDMIYVKDLCDMMVKALFCSRDSGYYNAGTGVGTTLLEQIQTIIDVFDVNKKCKLKFCPEKGNAPQYIMDITNAVNELGYKTKYNFKDALLDFKRYMDNDKKC